MVTEAVQTRFSRREEKLIYPSKLKDQFFLTDDVTLDQIAHCVMSGASVLEVGPGTGNLTERIAPLAKRVVAVEMDTKFEPVLTGLQADHPNVDVIYQNVLLLNLERLMRDKDPKATWQIISNLPFSITEPFLKSLVGLPIADAVLLLGRQMTDRLRIENPTDDRLSKTAIMVQTFFNISFGPAVPGESFNPQPATDTAVVILTPREEAEYLGNPKLTVLRKLFLTEQKHQPIKQILSGLSEGFTSGPLRDKKERNRHDRRENHRYLRSLAFTKPGRYYGDQDRQDQIKTDGLLSRLKLPDNILNQSFATLGNENLRTLVFALENMI